MREQQKNLSNDEELNALRKENAQLQRDLKVQVQASTYVWLHV